MTRVRPSVRLPPAGSCAGGPWLTRAPNVTATSTYLAGGRQWQPCDGVHEHAGAVCRAQRALGFRRSRARPDEGSHVLPLPPALAGIRPHLGVLWRLATRVMQRIERKSGRNLLMMHCHQCAGGNFAPFPNYRARLARVLTRNLPPPSRVGKHAWIQA